MNNFILIPILLVSLLIGYVVISAFNYLVLYLIKITGLGKVLDNYISISLLCIFFVILFSINANFNFLYGIGFFIGGILISVGPTYLFTEALFRKRNAYKDYSKNIKIFASIYSGMSFLVLSVYLNS